MISFRERRTSPTPRRMSVCFQRIESSSSCMQIALTMLRGSPSPPSTAPSKYLITPRQSQPSSSELVSGPAPYSPQSKKFLRYWVGLGSR